MIQHDQVMAWHLFGAKPFLEPMMTEFTDDYLNVLTASVVL